MNAKKCTILLTVGSVLCTGTALSRENILFDFNNYIPSLDKAYEKKMSSINSGYSLTFDSTGSENDNDFVFYKINDDLTTSAVYYRILPDFIGENRLGEVYNTIKSNSSSVNEYTGYFYKSQGTSWMSPGAFYNVNRAVIDKLTADFIDNELYLTGSSNNVGYGGGMQNGAAWNSPGTINLLVGDFIGNFVNQQNPDSSAMAAGGALANLISNIKEINANFIGNHVFTNGTAAGGAIVNLTGTIETLKGTFIGNYTEGGVYAQGGAIFNSAAIIDDETVEGGFLIPLIKADFIGNYAKAGSYASGGAIMNAATGVMPDIYGNFIGNYVSAPQALGGAINSPNGINTITGSFVNNYAESSGINAYGGAVYISGNMKFIADGLDNYFIGNYTKNKDGKAYNAIFVDNKSNDNSLIKLTFDITGKGNLYFNDSIMGRIATGEKAVYDIDIKGYGSGKFFMNNYISNAKEVNVDGAVFAFNKAPYTDDYGCGNNCKGNFVATAKDNYKAPDFEAEPITSLTLSNSWFYIYNGYADKIKMKNYTALGDTFLHIDVLKNNNEWIADILSVTGQIEGTTQVVVYDKTGEDNSGASVLFIEAPNDVNGTTPSVFRVYGSPYKWDVAYNINGETKGSYWYLVGTEEDNENEYIGYTPPFLSVEDEFEFPEPEVPETIEYNPEVIAGIGLHEAAIEQTRSVFRNVNSKVSSGRGYCPGCGIISDAWDGEKLRNIWVLAQGENANIEKPVNIDAEIWGIEGGFDFQNDVNNTLGIFVSYRDGNYDLSGEGAKLNSSIGSEIDIDSYLGGLYYRYDKNMHWLFAGIYGGIQNADINTNDGIIFDTDGVEFGLMAEYGKTYTISNDLSISPGIGIYYTQVNFDSAHDDMGKKYNWDNIQYTEAELGVKVEKNYDNGRIYIKPSIIQTLTTDDSVKISEINKIDTYHDQTLARFEIGGSYRFNENVYGYSWGNYTYGSSYDSLSLGVGINYTW
ncbi:MAG: autotransporter domain-containing protein [Alphaproteobacteria bacterium]|nr:autotransporter domain-containing protein [Alphaproteobacteria bacterium]